MIDIDKFIEDAKNLTLLYVEDDIDARENTLLILNDIFNNIIIAKDGQEGIEKFKSNKIDLVIADINMPVKNGLEMSIEIKELDDNIPILILTAITEIETIKNSIDIGIDGFINKPLDDVDMLFHKLNNIVKQINYDHVKLEQEKTKQEQEKIKLICYMIKNISHHWKQPLSVITAISSGWVVKNDLGMELNDDDFKNADKITQQAIKLGDMLSQIDGLNFDELVMSDIEKLIEISNPINENKK